MAVTEAQQVFSPTELARGFLASFKGFRAVHHLNDQVPEAAPPPEAKKPRPRTVLARRAQDIPQTKERLIPRQKSYIAMFFKCVFFNLLPVMVLFFVRKFDTASGTGFLSLLLNYTINLLIGLTFVTTKIVSLLWFGDVAKGAVNYRQTLRGTRLPTREVAFSRNISDLIYGILVELVFLGQVFFIYSLPFSYFSLFAGHVSMALLNSLYSFDYIWLSCGFNTNARIHMIESNWIYFTGYGCVLTFLTSLSEDFLINGFAFAGFFPFFIVSSYMVDIPVAASKCYKFPIFAPSTWIADRIMGFFLGAKFRSILQAIIGMLCK